MSVEKILQGINLDHQSFRQSLIHVTQNSRRVKMGSLFFALRGSDGDKKENVKEALNKGAVLAVHDCDDFKEGLFTLDVHRVFSDILKLLYKESFENLKIYGVTGTNGKTTYSYMLKSLLESYDVPTGIFGTIENSFREHKLETGLTSPIAEDFYAFSDVNYHQNGMRALVCEVSSHALDQKRMGLEFLDGAAFTSFSQDHLDYHKTMKSYFEAKLKIHKEASKSNSYFCASESLREFLKNPLKESSKKSFKESSKESSKESLKESLRGYSVDVLNYGDYKISSIKKGYGQEIKFSLVSKNKTLKGYLPLLGEYNVENFGLALMTLCSHFGEGFFPDDRVFKRFTPPPGRMQPVLYKDFPLAYIDYSHTPDSLQKALETLRALDKKVFVVFGCGGNRDQDKRSKMGEIAEALANFSFLTSDNPRDEDPRHIINGIVSGFKKKQFVVIENRKEAIASALRKALKENALVLIAGKGHEKTQEIAGEKKHFSDLKEVQQWVEKMIKK